MAEYYVKFTGQEEASGPFSTKDLKAFAELGRIDPKTLHYFDDLSGWQAIEANPALMSELFPSKKKLTFQSPPPPGATSSNSVQEVRKTVREMLEASEGKIKSRPESQKTSQPMTEQFALPTMGLLHLAMGAMLIYPQWDGLTAAFSHGQWMTLVNSVPGALGVWAIVVGLSGLFRWRVCYSWARYTGLLIMGYLALHAWVAFAGGNTSNAGLLLGAGLAFGVGVCAVTLTTRFATFCVALAVAFAGAISYGLVCWPIPV
jgi:hypothetical protein